MARNGDKLFQETFGRTPQTKVLDQVWANRDEGINIKQLSDRIRNSYVYTVNVVNDLHDRDLVRKEIIGRESIIRPNLRNGVVRSVTSHK